MTLSQLRKQNEATKKFKAQLLAAKIEHGCSYIQLGQLVGLSKSQTERLIRHPDEMSLANLRKFCNVLEVPFENFLVAYGFQR